MCLKVCFLVPICFTNAKTFKMPNTASNMSHVRLIQISQTLFGPLIIRKITLNVEIGKRWITCLFDVNDSKLKAYKVENAGNHRISDK